jgi:hypothetical protein
MLLMCKDVMYRGWPQCHWCCSHKMTVKNNIQVVYLHTKLALNGILKEYLRKEDRN